MSVHVRTSLPRPAPTPWDALLYAPTLAPTPTARPDAQGPKPGTKLAALLAELARRPDASTLTLSVCTDLTSRQVWGLLKEPRTTGQVTHSAGRWALVPGWAGRDVERAAALLRARGWLVEPPEAGDAHG